MKRLSALQELKLSPEDAAERLEGAAHSDESGADLWASLIVDAAVRNDGLVERTPLCLLSGQGHLHFGTSEKSLSGLQSRWQVIDFSKSETLQTGAREIVQRFPFTRDWPWFYDKRRCRPEVSVAGRPRFRRRMVCAKRCSCPGHAPMPPFHSDGTRTKTYAMRYVRRIRLIRRRGRRRSTAPIVSPQSAFRR